jgi:CubicO group peptidase (beta-lactamase class C family)
MKRRLTLFWLFLLVAAQAVAQTTPASGSAPSDAEIKTILADRIDTAKKSVGMVVGVIGAQGSHAVGYGKMSAGDPRTPDGDTVYEIGSVTKVFTSLLLADMVQKGEVKLDDPVSKYLPATVKVPERGGKKITLLDLATQSSGLPRMPSNFKPKDPSNPYADYTPAQMYEFISGYELTRDPGTKYEYSNLGVGLLGHALTLRAGKDYETLVRERILKPLKMNNTAVTFTPAMKAHLAPGHDAQLAPTANWDITTLSGAGAIRSTANDMLKFLSAWIGYTQSPLAAAMKTQLATRRPTGTPHLEIALGWHILSNFDREIIWHNGGTGGYHSFVAFDPKTRTGVVVLSNSANDIDDIGLHLMEPQYALVKIAPPREHKEVAVDPKTFDSLAGKYQLAPGAVLSIFRQEDKLFTQLTGQPPFQIFPESETEYFLKVVDAQLTFVKGADGKVTQVVLHQNGRDLPANKVE